MHKPIQPRRSASKARRSFRILLEKLEERALLSGGNPPIPAGLLGPVKNLGLSAPDRLPVFTQPGTNKGVPGTQAPSSGTPAGSTSQKQGPPPPSLAGLPLAPTDAVTTPSQTNLRPHQYLPNPGVDKPLYTANDPRPLVNVGPNILVNDPSRDGAQFTQSETTNAVFGSSILVGYNDSTAFTSYAQNARFTGYSLSTDGGQTFTELGPLPLNPNGDLGDPVVARDNTSGNVYFSTLAFSSNGFGVPAIQVFRSTDGGHTFSQPVNAAPGLPAFDFPDKDWLTVDNSGTTSQGNVYATYTDFGGSTRIVFSSSTDGGQTFGPSGGTTIATGTVQGSSVSVGPNGEVYVFWLDGNQAAQRLMMVKSTDHGATFGTAVTAATLNTTGINGDLGLGFRTNAFPHTAINPFTGDIYVAFNDTPGGGDRSNIYFTQSTDGGQTFSPAVTVNDDSGSNDQYQPVIAVKPNGSQLFIGWYDRRLDPSNNLIDVFGAAGNINTTTHAVDLSQPNFRITDQSFPPVYNVDPVIAGGYMGDYDTASADNGHFYMSWGDNRLGTAPDVRIASIDTGLSVTSTTPAAYSFVSSAPTSVDIHFSDALNPASVNLSGFTLDGVSPGSSTTSADHTTLTLVFKTSPATHEGPQTVVVATGAVQRQTDANPVQSFTDTFYYDTKRLQESSTSPANGSPLNLPGDLIVHFNEAVGAASVNTSNLIVSEGVVTAAALVKGDPTSVDYTISAPASADGTTLTVTLADGTLKDTDGNPGLGFTASYLANVLVSAYPVPLSPKAPQGSLVYDPSVSASIGFAGDTDSFTIALNAAQTASVAVTPAAGLQPKVSLFDGNGKLLASAQAAAAGKVAVLQTVAISKAGTYKITVQGVNSTTGTFTAQLTLNAALQTESNGGTARGDDTIAGAQDLSSAFAPLGNGGSRAAVLGTVPGGLVAGDVFINERSNSYGFGGKVVVFDNNGNVLETISNSALDAGVVSGVQLGPDNTVYVGVDKSGNGAFGAELVHFDAAGNLLGIINLPNEPSAGGAYYPFGFRVASDGSLWVPQPNSSTIIHTDNAGNLIQSYYVGGGPEDATVRADGQVFIANPGNSQIQQLDPGSGTVTEFLQDFNAPIGISFAQQGGNGDLVVTDFYNVVTYYTSSGAVDKFIPNSYYLNKAEPDPAGNTFTVSFNYGDLRKYDPSGNLIFDSYLGGHPPTHLAVVGVDGGVPTPPDTSDYYSFSLSKGQSAAIDLTALQGSGATFDLENGSGQVLALAHSASTGLSLNEFVAPAAGTFYVHVTGNAVKYNLVVTKSSDFDTGPNQSLTQPQALGNGIGVLGYAGTSSLLAKPGGPNVLYYVDFTYNNSLAQAFANLGVTPTVASSYSDFENKLASRDWDLVVLANQGYFDSSWVTPLSNYVAGGGRAILDSWLGGYDPPAVNTAALAFGASFTGHVDDTAINQTVTTDPIWKGISNPFALGSPYNYNTTGLHATTGQSIGTFTGSGDDAVVVGNNRHTILNGFLEDTPISSSQGVLIDQNEITALLVTTDTDYYTFSVSQPDRLTLTTSTPGGGSGQFPNTFDPKLILYGPDGSVIATDDNSAGDGRNAQINYKVPGGARKGIYTVEVLASDKTATPTGGEYVLSLAGNTGATPFTVTTTNPAPNSYVTSLTSVTVDFSNSIYLPSLSNSSLTVDGKAATGFTVNNDHEVVFTLPTLTGTGHNLQHTIKVASTVLSIQATALTGFSETIIVDNLPPKVISTSVEEGDVQSPGNLTYSVTFDDLIDTSVISTASFNLHGQYHNTDYTPLTYSFSNKKNQTTLTLTYQNVVDDVYTLTLFSQIATDGGPVTNPNGFRNIVSLALDGEPHTPRPPSTPSGETTPVPGGNFFVDFPVDTKNTQSFPTPLQVQPVVGSLVYQGSTTDVITTSSDSDSFSIKMDPGQTLTVDLTSDSNLQGAVTITGPSGPGIGTTVTAAWKGAEAVVQTVPVKSSGLYRINVVGANGTLGLYHLQATLNAALQTSTHGGQDAVTLSGNYYYEGTAQPTSVAQAAALAGTVTSTFSSTLFGGTTYNGGDGTPVPTFLGGDGGSLSPAPGNPSLNASYIDIKGTLTVSAPQSGLASFTLTSDDGAILTIDGSQVVNDDGVHGAVTVTNTVNLTAGTHTVELQYFNYYYYGFGGAYLAASGTFANGDPVLSAHNGSIGTAQDLTPSFVTLPGNGTRGAVLGQMNNPSDLSDYYAFPVASVGQSISLAVQSNNGTATLALFDAKCNPVALGVGGAANYDQGIANLVTRAAGTYYVRVQATLGTTYNLIVTRGLAFDTELNNTQATAQDITATSGGNDGNGGGALGAIFQPPGVLVGKNFEGLSYNDTTCGCYPPDGALAVGGGYVMEGVNTAIRVSDTSGNALLTQEESTFFAATGQGSGGDAYIVYDDIVNRWYVLALNSSLSGILFAVSKDSNPLDGFSQQYFLNLGKFIDFPKMGFNADAVVITGNDFSDGGTPLQGISIDKSALLSATPSLVDYTWQRDGTHFRAEVPAWMHGATTGGPMYLVEEAGYANGSAARVVTLTNILSTSPTFVDTNIPVAAYTYPHSANQPGNYYSVNTNDTTFTRADWRNGMLVSAQNVGLPTDGDTHVRWYEFNTTGTTPTLQQQGTVSVGAGTSTYFGSVALDANGDIGMSYMESSATEPVSVYVTGQLAGAAAGTLAPAIRIAAGTGSGPYNQFYRAGDFSGIAVDPSNPTTFWAENEYQGNAFWNTRVASFSIAPPADSDWYTVNTKAGDTLKISVSLPFSGPGEFIDGLSPVITLFDPNGTLVATSNRSFSYKVPSGKAGLYAVKVNGSTKVQGEYVLSVQGETGALAPVTVTKVNPAAGARLQPPTSVTVDFNHSIYIPSLSASELTVTDVTHSAQGTITATSFTVVNDHEVTWFLPSGFNGNDEVNQLQIAGGKIQDISGATVAAYTETYTTDIVAPTVVATSIEEGGILPVGSVTYVVTFSEKLDPSNFSAASFDLHGNFLNADYTPSTYNFDAAGKVLTINYASLPNDAYTLTLFSTIGTDGGPVTNPNGFQDLVGLALDGEPHTPRPPSIPSGEGVQGGNFFVDFGLALGTAAFPVPLQPVNPLGSLIYQGTMSSILVSPSDVDTFTLNLDPNQTITVVGTSKTLRGDIKVLDPSSHLIAEATASSTGATVLLETVPVGPSGVYRIVVSGLNGTDGPVSTRVILNSAVEGESVGLGTDHTPGTAQDLTNGFLSLGTHGAGRAGVLGSISASTVTLNAIASGWYDSTGFHDQYNSNYITGQYYGTLWNDYFVFDLSSLPAGIASAQLNVDNPYSTSPLASDSFLLSGVSTPLSDLEATQFGRTDIYSDLGSGTSYGGQTLNLNAVAGTTISTPLNAAGVNALNAGVGGPWAVGGSLTTIVGYGAAQFLYGGSGLGYGVQQLVLSYPSATHYYSFTLGKDQTATVALTNLTGGGDSIAITDGSGTVLASGTGVSTNVDQVIANYKALSAGTYYVAVTGNGGAATYSLVVTKSADFSVRPNGTPAQAQNLGATTGELGSIVLPTSVTVGQNVEGLGYSDTPGYLPPDGALAVGGGYVMEAVNTTIRISDTSGNTLQTQNLGTFFNQPNNSGGDPYIVYDDIANRWYVLALDANYTGILFAVSNDSNPLNGFTQQYFLNLGKFIDFPKMGFNADAVVITGNDFSDGGTPLQGISIDKTALLSGNLVDYTWQRDGTHFRAEVPAWMHGTTSGSPMYLVEEAGYGNGSAARVVTMTNILSTNPTFVDTDIPVAAYGFPPYASQPGYFNSVNTNDTTFTRADWRNGKLVSAQNVGLPSDGFTEAHVRWYEFDTTTTTPSLFQQGTISPGPGISTYYGSVALDANGDIGMSYMESSSSEYVSMYVNGRLASDPLGTMGPGTLVVPGIGTGYNFSRAGDYSGIGYDPTHNTFWAENEYLGSSFVWNTRVASFTVASPADPHYFSESLAAGATIALTTSTPGGGPGEFINNLSPHILLIGPDGTTVVLQGTKLSDGRNETLTYTVPAGKGGVYYVEVTSDPGTQGEFYLNDPVTLPGAYQITAAVTTPVGTTTVAPAGGGLAALAGLYAPLGSDGVSASSGSGATAPQAGPATVLAVPGRSAGVRWSTRFGASAPAPVRSSTAPWQPDVVVPLPGQEPRSDLLAATGATSRGPAESLAPDHGSGSPPDLTPETTPAPDAVLWRNAVDLYFERESGTDGEVDTSLGASGDPEPSWKPAVFSVAIGALVVGGFAVAPAMETSKRKRQRFLDPELRVS